MIKLDYKNTDKKIEIDIYGMIFEINKKIEEIDLNKINENEDISLIIDEILGIGSVNKINEKRKNDGYEGIDTQVALTIISACMQAYTNASVQPVNDLVNNYENNYNRIDRRINNMNNRNRRERRNYKYRRY